MLKLKALTATLWSSADILIRQGIQFVATLVLARILVPADFGAIAMIVLFIAVAGLLADAGLGLALIQSPEVSHDDESTVFWCSLGIGAGLAAALYALAPSVARFYELPILAALMRFMAVTPLLAASAAVHFALLTRKLDFRTQALSGGIGALAAGVMAIVVASRGGGAWALATLSVMSLGCTSIMLWVFHNWRPAFTFRRSSLQKLGSFGGFALAANLSETLYARLYALVGGRLFGPRELGYYANAEILRQLPATFLGGIVARVVLPIFARAQDDPALMRRGVQLSVRGMMLVVAPGMFALAALAEPIVLALYGSKWLPAVPFVRVLALAGVLFPLHLVNIQALLAMGEARLVLRLEFVKKTIGVALLLVGAHFGLMGMAWSQVIFSLLVLVINARYTRRWFGYGVLAQLRDAGPALGVGLAVAVGAYVLAARLQSGPWLTLLVCCLAGSTCYALLMAALRTDAWEELESLWQAYRQKPEGAGP